MTAKHLIDVSTNVVETEKKNNINSIGRMCLARKCELIFVFKSSHVAMKILTSEKEKSRGVRVVGG